MRQFIALMACSLLVVPAHATDDDRYSYSPPRFQDYQTPYKPPTNYSPTQFLDRQINNQNAALQHRFGARAEFKPTAFTLASVNTPAWAPPRFEFSPPNFKPLATFKADLPKPALSKPEPKGFLGSIGAGVKGVFNALAAAVQKVGQAIGKMFTIDKAKITYEAQRDRLLKDNPALREISRGLFQVPPGQQFQHAGLTWEPNSTFKMNDDGRGLHLDQGVTLSPDLGGIRRADGQPLPVIMTLDDNRLIPVGIDFSRVEPQTPFNYTHPVAIGGLGTVPAGATMTFEGISTKFPSPLGRGQGEGLDSSPAYALSFQNARIDNPGKALEGIANLRNEKITLTQMEVRLQGKLNEINSLRVNRADEKLFVSQYGETFSISQLEKKTAQATALSADLAQRSAKLSNDVTSAVLHSNVLAQKLHTNTATPPTVPFEVKEAVETQSSLTQALQTKTNDLNSLMAQGEYADVANAITNLQTAQVDQKAAIDTLQSQADMFQAYKRSLRGLERAHGQLSAQATPASMQTDFLTVDQLQDAARYFPDEKHALVQDAQSAITALQSMADQGILSPDVARLKCAEVMLIRNHLLAATPDTLGNNVIKAADKMEKGYIALDHAADWAVFNHLDKLAETHPKVTQALGQGALAVTGGMVIVGAAMSPVSTGVIIAAGATAQQGFEAMGLSPRAAAVYAALTTAPVAAGVIRSPSIQKADSSVGSSLIGFFRWAKTKVQPETEIPTDVWQSQRGRVLVSSGRSAVGNALRPSNFQSVRTPYGDAFQSLAPEAVSARALVQSGQPLYRIGRVGKSEAVEAQFWAMEHPLTPNYQARYGIPPANIKDGQNIFIEIGKIKPGTPFVTRPAPPSGTNPGGGIEVVVAPGGVQVETFSVGRRKP